MRNELNWFVIVYVVTIESLLNSVAVIDLIEICNFKSDFHLNDSLLYFE